MKREGEILKNKIAGLSKSYSAVLKRNGIEFEYNNICSLAYKGEGFYINHKEKVKEELPIYGYDIHWAYGSVLKNNILPLSERLGNKETELAIYFITFKGNKKDYQDWYKVLKPRYKEFTYTLFNKVENWISNSKLLELGLYGMYLTNLDYEILCDLYENEFEINSIQYFQDIGYMPQDVKDFIDNLYEKKKTMTAIEKTALEAAIYGMSAKKLDYKGYENQKNEYLKATGLTHLTQPRNKKVPLAIWQASYTRYREWQLFKKYINNVVYMNTDSIYCDKKTTIPYSDKLGDFKLEYNGDTILFIRRNVYVVFDKNGNIKDKTIGGVINPDDLTISDVNNWRLGKSVIMKSYSDKKHNKEIEVEIIPYFNPNHINWLNNKKENKI